MIKFPKVFLVGCACSGIAEVYNDIISRTGLPGCNEKYNQLLIDNVLRQCVPDSSVIRAYQSEEACVDKTHLNLWMVEKHADAFPDAIFVGLKRNVNLVVSQMLRMQSAKDWCTDYAIMGITFPSLFLGATTESEYQKLQIKDRCRARVLSHYAEIDRLAQIYPNRFVVINFDDKDTLSRKIDNVVSLICLNPIVVAPPPVQPLVQPVIVKTRTRAELINNNEKVQLAQQARSDRQKLIDQLIASRQHSSVPPPPPDQEIKKRLPDIPLTPINVKPLITLPPTTENKRLAVETRTKKRLTVAERIAAKTNTVMPQPIIPVKSVAKTTITTEKTILVTPPEKTIPVKSVTEKTIPVKSVTEKTIPVTPPEKTILVKSVVKTITPPEKTITPVKTITPPEKTIPVKTITPPEKTIPVKTIPAVPVLAKTSPDTPPVIWLPRVEPPPHPLIKKVSLKTKPVILKIKSKPAPPPKQSLLERPNNNNIEPVILPIDPTYYRTDFPKNLMFYWINLDRAPQRRKRMEEEFKKRNIPNKRITAIDGLNTDLRPYLDKSIPQTNIGKHRYEIAASLSHLKALQAFVNDGADIGIICEDDVSFEYESLWKRSLKDQIAEAPSDWCVLQLGLTINIPKEWHTIMAANLTYHQRKMHWYSALAYAVRRSYAVSILTEHSIPCEGDKFYCDLKVKNIEHVQSERIVIGVGTGRYTVYPPVFTYPSHNNSFIHPNHLRLHENSKNLIAKAYIHNRL